ncbi:MAG: hypothetical protein Q4A15_03700 [Prevotellaceae bacterium]|nr:hypothetical protein [Prevotellaceae bacterium]
MNNIEKLISKVSKDLGTYLCEAWADNEFCDHCPYHGKCGHGTNALVRDINNFLTNFIMEEEK